MLEIPQATGIAVKSDGSIYLSDSKNHQIQHLTEGKLDTLAGSGEAGFVDGNGQAAQFNAPHGLAIGMDESV